VSKAAAGLQCFYRGMRAAHWEPAIALFSTIFFPFLSSCLVAVATAVVHCVCVRLARLLWCPVLALPSRSEPTLIWQPLTKAINAGSSRSGPMARMLIIGIGMSSHR
jgi:hypothetical protein